jgi:hypothetical protein
MQADLQIAMKYSLIRIIQQSKGEDRTNEPCRCLPASGWVRCIYEHPGGLELADRRTSYI